VLYLRLDYFVTSSFDLLAYLFKACRVLFDGAMIAYLNFSILIQIEANLLNNERTIEPNTTAAPVLFPSIYTPPLSPSPLFPLDTTSLSPPVFTSPL
jgi:hypothetical protein